ncbi:MAG: AAA family ATPase, partial [Nitrospirae bacterium]|nr:AAA family ATPase [Nitrospirota bacterium]
MYTNHFGLTRLPFENVPDPAFFFDQGDHARIRTRITDSLKAGRGLIVVTGPIGSGKTTISQKIISDFSSTIKLIWMAEPPANSLDLFLFIAQGLGLKPQVSERVFILRDIKEALLKINSEGSKCLLIIDESHLMGDDTLNGLRLLNNLEEGAIKLIQMLLLGQEELMKTVNKPEMEPFKQRIAALEIMGKMGPDRIREYILHRIRTAGGQPSIFSDTGLEALVVAFGPGNTPRVINLLCNKSLNLTFEKGKPAVDLDDIYEAAGEMGMQKEVFHYKMTLRRNEIKKQAIPPIEKAPIREAEAMQTSSGKEPAAAGIGHMDIQPETFQPVQTKPAISSPVSGAIEKGL